jgi:hypothetical protein
MYDKAGTEEYIETLPGSFESPFRLDWWAVWQLRCRFLVPGIGGKSRGFVVVGLFVGVYEGMGVIINFWVSYG